MRNLLASTAIVLCLSGGFNVPVALGQENTEVSHLQTISDEQAHTIVINGTPQELKKLLQAGYDVNKVYLCNTLLVNAIKSAARGSQAIENPTYALEKVKILVDAGADVNLSGCKDNSMRPLAWSVILPYQVLLTVDDMNEIIDEKIQKGTEYCNFPGVISKPCGEITAEERAFMRRTLKKDFEDTAKNLMPVFMGIIKYLIKNGADVNGTDIQNQATLHHSVTVPEYITVEPTKYLLEKGADVNAQDIYGQTPLFFAHGSHNDKVVKMLIDAGADDTIKSKMGNLYYSSIAIVKRGHMGEDGKIKIRDAK